MTADTGTVLVRLRGQLKKLAGDQAEHELVGANVAELMRALEQAHPALAGWILDERGHIRRHINVFVNTEQAREDAPIAAGDCVDVLPAISGGR
jgi:sulfur-carrier protein